MVSENFIEVTKDTFSGLVEANKDKVIVNYFTASWCPPCKKLGPILEELAQDRQDIVVLKIDVDKNQDLSAQYSIRNIPMMIFFKDGTETHKTVGLQPKSEITKIIDSL